MKATISIIVAYLLLFNTSTQAQNCTIPNSVVAVYKTKNAQFEYVNFKVKLPFTGAFTVTTQTPPFSFPMDEGGENFTTMPGCAFQKIMFTGMSWMCLTKPNNSLPTTRIVKVRRVGNFEGMVSFLVGYKCPSNKYIGQSSFTSGGYKIISLKFRK
jgi:hypothetical protein